jgi:hypothetical protein
VAQPGVAAERLDRGVFDIQTQKKHFRFIDVLPSSHPLNAEPLGRLIEALRLRMPTSCATLG